MKIEIQSVNLKQGKPRYFVTTGNDDVLAYFDSLEVTACVVRYLSGATMGAEDSTRAVEAIRSFDRFVKERAIKGESEVR